MTCHSMHGEGSSQISVQIIGLFLLWYITLLYVATESSWSQDFMGIELLVFSTASQNATNSLKRHNTHIPLYLTVYL